jgi:NAD(P)-dependent dehydrogenase (short-subunit alcohol dehydrogenase family)
MTDLAGRGIVITGIAGGIGSAAADALRARGAAVAGIDLAASAGVFPADVRDREQLSAAMGAAAAHLGGIDVLITCAGIGRAQDSGDFPTEASREVLEINLVGTWNSVAAALPHLLRSRGHVVTIASALAAISAPWAAAYAASKRGVAAYSDALRLEYAGRLTVTTVYPGYIRTAIHDVVNSQGATMEGAVRPDTLEQAAAAIVRACERRPRAVATSSRTAVGVWFGRHLPALADAVIRRGMMRARATRPLPSFVRADAHGIITPPPDANGDHSIASPATTPSPTVEETKA